VDPATAVASAWSSGISMYAVAAVLGIAGRLDWTETPGWLQRPGVIAAALALFAVEFVLDKVPAVDTTWDAVHTAARPLAGAVLMAGSDADATTAALAALGGVLALSSHAAKATLRALVNTSPEPVSNAVVSTGEDGLVVTVMALAIAAPGVALALTAVLFVASIVTTVVLFRSARRTWRRLAGRSRSATGPPGRRAGGDGRER
jgi:hypothetical protein